MTKIYGTAFNSLNSIRPGPAFWGEANIFGQKTPFIVNPAHLDQLNENKLVLNLFQNRIPSGSRTTNPYTYAQEMLVHGDILHIDRTIADRFNLKAGRNIHTKILDAHCSFCSQPAAFIKFASGGSIDGLACHDCKGSL